MLKQAADEYDVKKRLHDNIIVELELVRESWQVAIPSTRGIAGYIQGLGVYPFYVILYTERQVMAYVDVCKRNINSVMHLDNTGSVITDITGQKKPYYYCLYNPETKLPACEFLTTKHSATWLSCMLEIFCEDAKLVNGRKYARPKFVVTDFSFALIYAILQAFNKMPLVEYLKFAYTVMMRQCITSCITRLTYITLCSAHFSKTLCNRLVRSEPIRRIRRAAMVMFTLLMRTTSLRKAVNVYRNIFVVMCTKYDSNAVEKSFNNLKKYIRRGIPDRQEITDAVDLFEDEVKMKVTDELMDSDASMKEKSPFTKHFAESIRQIQTNIESTTDGELNNMYSPKGFAVIESFIHLYPLWAAALHENVERFAKDVQKKHEKCDSTFTPKCRTNAVIESHFKSVKHNKKHRRKVRPRVFVKERLKSVLLD